VRWSERLVIVGMRKGRGRPKKRHGHDTASPYMVPLVIACLRVPSTYRPNNSLSKIFTHSTLSRIPIQSQPMFSKVSFIT